MIHRIPDDGASARMIVPLQFADFAVSWAGPGARDGDACFGSEDGQLEFRALDDQHAQPSSLTGCSREAVNGVAFVPPAIAVSTRNQVAVITPNARGNAVEQAVFPCGAHGVIATASGYFVAPLGPTGLLEARPDQSDSQRWRILGATKHRVDYYKVVCLSPPGNVEVLVCATRADGVVATEFRPEGHQWQFNSVTIPGVDVVDVCSLESAADPRGVAAVGRDGALMLFTDVLHDHSPLAMRFAAIQGTAYRLFCVQGSILLLTSAGIYVLTSLAKRFLQGEPVNQLSTLGSFFPLEAVDANVCGDRWLLVVTPADVLRLDLDLLIAAQAQMDSTEIRPEANSGIGLPTWTPYEGAIELVSS